jgi:glycosyltransferase involved in cell wall biosynthesis
MLNLLLVAPCADGEDVGEAWIGYQWARLLAERHEVTLLTYHKRGRTPISRQLPGLRVIEWTEPPLIGRAERFNSLLKPAYIPFYAKSRRWIRERVAAGEHFDLGFQPIPVAMRYPSPLVDLGIPYVLGPVGGAIESPPGFRTEDTAPWYVGLRSFDSLRMRRDPLLRGTYSGADCVLGIAPYVADFLAGTPLRRFEVMSDTGIEELPSPVDRSSRPADAVVRLLFVGRLIRTKGVRDAIRALGIAGGLPVVFDIVGEGRDRAACEELTAELGLTEQVRFHGKVERSQVDDFYRAADIFVFPSYREPGGSVVAEAMAYGLPLIVSDNGGPGSAVDETAGIRLHPVSPGQYAADLAEAITRLVKDRKTRLELGAGARRRVAEIALWESKVTRFELLGAGLVAARDGRGGAGK